MGRPVLNAAAEWKADKADTICRLIGRCNCPGDEMGGYTDRAICFLAADLIDRLTKEYAEDLPEPVNT